MPLNKALMITPEMKQATALAAAVETYRKAIQSLIDGKAQEKQYDDGNSLASYVNSTVPEWAAEAQTFVVWRDQVWAYALAELLKVQKAEREQPTVDDFLAELPAFEWQRTGESE
ncbi:hypothetical protein N7376_22205 [Brucella intermedia GD04153]|uniref:Uncharacterized protein n=1 Tax=Brucella intermedia GD04153 TaxID=2975438 RepID=A0AA42H119_9HYPH|nr:hypothetical protein [Brucella intermedia]MDH0126693.1 hypothetical protein [Brucella intermedia GD04153]